MSNNFRIEVYQKGASPEVMLKDINLKFINYKNALIALGEEAKKVMRMKIKLEVSEHSTGNLERNIESYPLTDGSVGVGRISLLNRNAKYWRVINYGGYTPPANIGYWGDYESPRAGATGQRWTHLGIDATTGEQGGFLMKPKKAITGINFIEYTKAWLVNIGKVHFYNYFINSPGGPVKIT